MTQHLLLCYGLNNWTGIFQRLIKYSLEICFGFKKKIAQKCYALKKNKSQCSSSQWYYCWNILCIWVFNFRFNRNAKEKVRYSKNFYNTGLIEEIIFYDPANNNNNNSIPRKTNASAAATLSPPYEVQCSLGAPNNIILRIS